MTKKAKKPLCFSYSINKANIEAFWWAISCNINLLFESTIYIPYIFIYSLGKLQWERDIPQEALDNLQNLANSDFKKNLGKIIHDIYLTGHNLFKDMPQGNSNFKILLYLKFLDCFIILIIFNNYVVYIFQKLKKKLISGILTEWEYTITRISIAKI